MIPPRYCVLKSNWPLRWSDANLVGGIGVLQGPTDPWPAHTHPAWKESLAFARANGWYLKVLTSHGWGVVYCNPRLGEDPCKLRVESTGRATENVARKLRTMVDRCQHRPSMEAQAPTRLEKARRHLLNAERFLDAAERCARGDELKQEAEGLLLEAITNLADADLLLQAASEVEQKRSTLDQEASRLLSDAGLPASDLASAEPTKAASGALTQADAELRRVAQSSPEKRRLQTWSTALHDRMSGLDERGSQPSE